jgi:hypothetical protein
MNGTVASLQPFAGGEYNFPELPSRTKAKPTHRISLQDLCVLGASVLNCHLMTPKPRDHS